MINLLFSIALARTVIPRGACVTINHRLYGSCVGKTLDIYGKNTSEELLYSVEIKKCETGYGAGNTDVVSDADLSLCKETK